MPLQPIHASEVEEHPKEDVSNDEPGVSAIGQGRRGRPSQETMAKAKQRMEELYALILELSEETGISVSTLKSMWFGSDTVRFHSWNSYQS